MAAGGSQAGVAVDLLKAVVPPDVTVEVEPDPAPRELLRRTSERIYARLEASEWCGSLDKGLWSEPVMALNTRLYSSVNKPVEFETLDDLNGLTVGCIKNYSYPAIQPYFDAGKMTRYDTNSVSLLLKMLTAGRVDCAVIDEAEARWLIRTSPDWESSNFHEAQRPVSTVQLRFVFSNVPAWEKRMSEVNTRIKLLRENGWFDRILSHYL
ncbi:hypothetical protein PSDVSF_08010 [Pseudodesulfovibrio sediminis]|uniref:Solute-binding protein family 3/N-terminal domain-containing protein n=2 Tax=Pseudodesulfovibrio sediminis TaxID=2810563 RepID=A0ABN6EQN8_9BACT|nr:hypothetical protein PSDVSF_08010 [Pseudodesulfovibrio sediminis]